MPNEPPTWPVTTRTLSAGAPRISISPAFMPTTPWLDEFNVHLPVAGSNSPMATRGSMALTTMRWFDVSSRVTCLALAKAAATFSASPKWKSSAMLFGALS